MGIGYPEGGEKEETEKENIQGGGRRDKMRASVSLSCKNIYAPFEIFIP